MMQQAWLELTTFLDSRGIWFAAASVALFILSLVMMPRMLARIPADYFTHARRQRISRSNLRHPGAAMLLLLMKNLAGALLLLSGLIMLFTPGPGSITMLTGLILMDYPGKYRLESWLIRRPLLLHAINAMRRNRGEPPLLPPEG